MDARLLTSIDSADEGATLRKIYLYPGQIFVSDEPALVSTILGSCVAVCLWDEVAGLAGINHYLLPSAPTRSVQSDLRYGRTATERLIETMTARGGAVDRMVAKVVGGASVLGAFTGARKSIGDTNIAVAREVLERHRITVVAEQTGGQRGRKLLFHTGNGCAYSKEI
jgi:chemotaxis protein CheD